MAEQRQVDQALEVWQSYYTQPLTQEDGEEIVDTMTAYLSLIAEWVHQDQAGGIAS